MDISKRSEIVMSNNEICHTTHTYTDGMFFRSSNASFKEAAHTKSVIEKFIKRNGEMTIEDAEYLNVLYSRPRTMPLFNYGWNEKDLNDFFVANCCPTIADADCYVLIGPRPHILIGRK